MNEQYPFIIADRISERSLLEGIGVREIITTPGLLWDRMMRGEIKKTMGCFPPQPTDRAEIGGLYLRETRYKPALFMHVKRLLTIGNMLFEPGTSFELWPQGRVEDGFVLPIRAVVTSIWYQPNIEHFSTADLIRLGNGDLADLLRVWESNREPGRQAWVFEWRREDGE